MTAGPYRPPANLSPCAIDSESLTTLLKVAGLVGLAGAGVVAADQRLLRSRVSHPWESNHQDQALRPDRIAVRPSTPIVATQTTDPQRSPNAAELSQPTPLPRVIAPSSRLSKPNGAGISRLGGSTLATASNSKASNSKASNSKASTSQGSATNESQRSSPSSTAGASNPAEALAVPDSLPPVAASANSVANTPDSAEQVATIDKPSFSRFFRPATASPQPTQSTVAKAQTEVVPAIVAGILNRPAIRPKLSPNNVELAKTATRVTITSASDSNFPDSNFPDVTTADSNDPRAIPLPVLRPAPGISPAPLASTTPTFANDASVDASAPNTEASQPSTRPSPAVELVPKLAQTPDFKSSPRLETPAPAVPSRRLAKPNPIPPVEAPIPKAPEPVLEPVEPVAINPSLAAAAQPKVRFVGEFEVTGSSVYDAEELAIAARNAISPITDSTANSTTTDSATTPTSDDPAAVSEDGNDVQTTRVNRDLSAAELVLASEAITQRYVDDGYINSGAYVPEAVLEGGPAEIRVLEGSLDAINVNVEPPRKAFSLGQSLKPGYVERRLARATDAPLNINKLVDGVRLLELDPVIESVSTELVPGTETGTSTLNVTVLPAKPFEASVSVDNSRSPSVGSIQQQLNVSQANLLGVGDRLNIAASRSSGSNSVNLGYSIPVNARNGTLGLSFSRSSSKVVEAPFDELDIESKARTYEVSYRQPIIQTPNEELGLSLKAFRRASEGFFLDGATPFPSRGSDEDGRTRISALRFGQDWTKRQPKQVLSLQSEFSLGLGLFDATVSSNNDASQPDGQFFAWRGRGQWVRRLGSDVLLSVKGDTQLAANPLLSSEQFGLGGVGTVRGYRSNSLLTDSGWLASAEVQVPVVRIPKWDSTIKLVPFLDMGGGWNLGVQEQPETSRLMSTGVGVLWDLGDRFRARLDWGFPLTSIEGNDGESLQEKGINFSVRWNGF